MDTIADLLRRAVRYRTLASQILDEQTHTGLLALAEKYEALAQEMQAEVDRNRPPH